MTTPAPKNLRASPFKLNQSSQHHSLTEDSIFSSDAASKLDLHQISTASLNNATAPSPEPVNPAIFEKLTKIMFRFPVEMIGDNKVWFNELQHPLDFTVAEINTDLTKFVKDFPKDIIPHQTDAEFKLGTRHIHSNIKLASEGRLRSHSNT